MISIMNFETILKRTLVLVLFGSVLNTIAQEIHLLPYDHLQWQLDNHGDLGPCDVDLDLIDAWQITTGGNTFSGDEIVIAIIDRGVQLTHEDLASNIWINKDEIPDNGIDDDANGYIDDIHGWNFHNDTNDVGLEGYGHPHGTAVNGIIGADGTNDIGISGVNQSVKLLNLVRGDDTTSIFKCYEYLIGLRKKFNETEGKEGALVVAVNQSWGVGSLFASDNPHWCHQIDAMGEQGILSVAAAPNEAIDIDLFGDLPSLCPSDYQISVTNSNYLDEKIMDAGYGVVSVDLSAPGHNSFTTAMNDNYAYFSGTSAAAPYVAGAIGILYALPSVEWEKFRHNSPSAAALLIRNQILHNTDALVDGGELIASGGRLNIYKAMKGMSTALHAIDVLDQLNRKNEILSLYPNPTVDKALLVLETKQAAWLTLGISSVNGAQVVKSTKKWLNEGINSISLDVSTLNQGYYLVSITNEFISETVKLIKY